MFMVVNVDVIVNAENKCNDGVDCAVFKFGSLLTNNGVF